MNCHVMECANCMGDESQNNIVNIKIVIFNIYQLLPLTNLNLTKLYLTKLYLTKLNLTKLYLTKPNLTKPNLTKPQLTYCKQT